MRSLLLITAFLLTIISLALQKPENRQLQTSQNITHSFEQFIYHLEQLNICLNNAECNASLTLYDNTSRSYQKLLATMETLRRDKQEKCVYNSDKQYDVGYLHALQNRSTDILHQIECLLTNLADDRSEIVRLGNLLHKEICAISMPTSEIVFLSGL